MKNKNYKIKPPKNPYNGFLLDSIIFDFDGVIVDSNGIKSAAFESFYRDNPKFNQIKSFLDSKPGLSRFEKFKFIENHILKKDFNQKKNELLNAFSQQVTQKVIQAKWIEGAEDFLKYISNIIPIHLVSATPIKELMKILEEREMKFYFRSIYGSPKTKVENIEELILKNNYSRNKLIMIGDSYEDFIAAKKLDLSFIGKTIKNKKIFPNKIIKIEDLSYLNKVI